MNETLGFSNPSMRCIWPRLFSRKLSGHHYESWGGCQIPPLNWEAKLDWQVISGFAISSAGTVLGSNASAGVKFKICTPQQLQMQNGEHKSPLCSLECELCDVAATFVSVVDTAAPSAHGRQDRTKRITDNMVLQIFIVVKVKKLLIYGWRMR